MKIYKVTYIVPGKGSYCPPDPMGDGGYYRDKYGVEIITAPTAKIAEEVVKKVYPTATVKRPKLIFDLVNKAPNKNIK